MTSSKKRRERAREIDRRKKILSGPSEGPPGVDSLLDFMKEGAEYQSIVGAKLKPGREVLDDIVKAMNDIRAIRGRPCISYIGNVSATQGANEAGVDSSDDLPFHEMVAEVPSDTRSVDVILSTGGGSAHQVSRFVNCLRSRFDEVDFLLPSFCMSAGTLFALSGDRIWMTERACLGPIDPQVPTKDGRYVPAQALLVLVNELRQQGMDALNDGKPIPWTAVRIIDSLDKKELANAISATRYSTEMAAEFLRMHKFKHWLTREGTGQPVTDEYRARRSTEIAVELASHDKWKSHGHAISREVLWNQISLKIDHPDLALERAIRRFWALVSWMFDKTTVIKALVSPQFRYLKTLALVGIKS